MVFFTWLVQITNQLFVKTILLSFLIALVKKVYDGQMKGYVENNYQARAEMNLKSSLMLKIFGLIDETDLIILSADFATAPQVKGKSEDSKIIKDVQILKNEMSEMK